MSGCRIGKVKMKSGGAPIHLVPINRTHFHSTVENLAESIDADTHAVGFFVLTKRGDLTAGISYGSYFTQTQLKGACDNMKDILIEDIWSE